MARGARNVHKSLQALSMGVSRDGARVFLHVGNARLELSYEDALNTGLALRHQGNLAKREVGDNRSEFMICAELTDGIEEARKQQKRRDASATFLKLPVNKGKIE